MFLSFLSFKWIDKKNLLWKLITLDLNLESFLLIVLLAQASDSGKTLQDADL